MPYGAVNSRTSRSYEPCRPVRIPLSTGTRAAETPATVRGSIGQTGPTTGALLAGALDDGAGLVLVGSSGTAAVAAGVGTVVEPPVGAASGVLPALVQAAD